MGLLLSLPLGGVATSCLAGVAFCFTSTAGMAAHTKRRLCKLQTLNLLLVCSVIILQIMQLQQLDSHPCRLRCKESTVCSSLRASVLLCLTMSVRSQIIFLLNSMLAWIMNSKWAISLLEKWSYDYIKMDCTGNKCYGVLAVSDGCQCAPDCAHYWANIPTICRYTGYVLLSRSSMQSWLYHLSVSRIQKQNERRYRMGEPAY